MIVKKKVMQGRQQLSILGEGRQRIIKLTYYPPGQNDKYWCVKDGGIYADSEVPQGFYLELREPAR